MKLEAICPESDGDASGRGRRDPRRASRGPSRRASRARCIALTLVAVAAGLFVAGLVAIWMHGDHALDWLDLHTTRTRAALRDALHREHGLVFYASFDENQPADFVTGSPLRGSGTVRAQGPVGTARRFDGRPGENLVSRHLWNRLGRNGLSLAFWLRLPHEESRDERRIFWDHDQTGRIGMRILGGGMEVVFTDASGAHALSAPVSKPGAFSHVALVLGPDRAALFLNGRECASCPVAAPLALPAHPVSLGTDIHHPAACAIDEWSLWNRPLSAAEAAQLASVRRPLPRLLEPRLSSRLRRREALSSACRFVLSVLGAFGSSQSSPALFNRSIPPLDLRFPGGALRHLRFAHLEALSSGGRTDRGAKPRRGQASLGSHSEPVLAWLDDAAVSARPAFLLAVEGGLFGEGSGVARLFPPEQFGIRHPDAAFPLPLTPSSLVRLHLNGDFLGLYCLVSAEAPAPPWFATGARDVSRPDRLHFSTPTSDAATGAGLSKDERDDAWRRMLSLLRTDPGFPLTPAEARALAHRHAEAHRTLLLPDPAPGPEPFLGANPAALYVTTNLNLAAAGPDVAWRSSDPATISADGQVSRPGDGRPRLVEFTETLPGGATRVHRFRVMPRSPQLPALFLSVGRPLDKLSRTDFTCLRIPAGENPKPSWLFGTGPGGGGVKLRGNTSYQTGRRRSMNLEFDEAVSLPGVDPPVRHLLLLAGYADPTRLRNALAFDAFRAMSPGAARATPVSWTEVFVNGAYAGVWECCPRLQDALSEPFSDLFKVRSQEGLWTDPDATAESVDRVDRTEAADPYESIRELARLVSGMKPAAFAAKAPGVFDIDELIDFWLLLNFTGNEDGRVTNQFIGRRASDGRWLLLPWDYDKTFLPGRLAKLQARGQNATLTNPVFRRLFAGDPAFRDRLGARWRELRAGPLSNAALDAWIDEHSSLLAPFMDEDYRVVPPLGHDGDYAAAVDALRTEVHASADWLDGLFPEKHPHNEAKSSQWSQSDDAMVWSPERMW